jgi:hypothetical protein
MEIPDYAGGGILNLMSSLEAALRSEPGPYAPCALLADGRLARARQVLLLVVDGLGWNYLRAVGAGTHLHAHCLGSLSSAAPPTTAAAIPLFLTAAPPALHGFTGWFTWLRELGCVSAVLPFVTRHGQLPLSTAAVGPRQLAGAAPLFERLGVECHVLSPRHIADSPFNRAFSSGARVHAYEGLKGFFRTLGSLLRRGRGRRYVYAYWPELDSLAHEHGIGSGQVLRHLAAFDEAFGRLLRSVRGTDTALLVTADHGFVDVPPERVLRLQDHPDLADCLALPLCGEPRCAFCYVRPERREPFKDYVRAELSGQVDLRPSRELVEQGLFGPGPRHPELPHRVGDYTLLLRENYVLKDRLPGEREFHHIGAHGGLSADELSVPLIYIET